MLLIWKIDSLKDVERTERDLKIIGMKYHEFIKEQMDIRKKRHLEAIDLNYDVLKRIASKFRDCLPPKNESSEQNPNTEIQPFLIDSEALNEVYFSFRQIRRDWSSSNAPERNQCYKRLIDFITKEYPNGPDLQGNNPRGAINVLCPGPGLGRLLFELAQVGFSPVGVEFSYHMAMISDFMINRTTKIDEFTIQPGIHNFLNAVKEDHIFENVSFPDVHPKSLIAKGAEIKIKVGKFLESCATICEEYDVVATCFFLDTAANIVEYIETIHRVLKKGNIWVNIGPLLYYNSQENGRVSIELSWEQIKVVMEKMGFVIEFEDIVECQYCDDKNKLMNLSYKGILFSARKGE